ncbi:hypothetical protein MSG28_005408 [Choristoneura fumiferana]|uniref:Uncharacterized protein n=1 Tax=Choristoneura fumiferana TaxID=7141 RepID=A0ACC0JRF8_CHOFU|nr:hypothetical protein MSG28_005408 [Choristoneura fumiferana]
MTVAPYQCASLGGKNWELHGRTAGNGLYPCCAIFFLSLDIILEKAYVAPTELLLSAGVVPSRAPWDSPVNVLVMTFHLFSESDSAHVGIDEMMPSITRFLMEGAELLHQDCSSMERVMRYLEANLDTLYQHLNNDNFSRTLDIVWEQLGEVLYELIQANLEKEKIATRIRLIRRRYFEKNKISPHTNFTLLRHRKVKITRYINPRRLNKSAAANLDAKRRPPSFFSNLHECLKIMVRSFRQDNKDIYSSETLKRVEYLLKLHGMETRELIHQYHLERWQEQQAITEPKMGILTVRAQFYEDNLKLEILNARNLVATDSNDMFSMNNAFVGEAYLSFSDVPETPAPISSLPQQHLFLMRPSSIEYAASQFEKAIMCLGLSKYTKQIFLKPYFFPGFNDILATSWDIPTGLCPISQSPQSPAVVNSEFLKYKPSVNKTRIHFDERYLVVTKDKQNPLVAGTTIQHNNDMAHNSVITLANDHSEKNKLLFFKLIYNWRLLPFSFQHCITFVLVNDLQKKKARAGNVNGVDFGKLGVVWSLGAKIPEVPGEKL